uniref:Uncharacterized protein n=1 Tax=viral metagenome TaxID=1070528 RepID=A0A6C0IDI7_9ZZZZ
MYLYLLTLINTIFLFLNKKRCKLLLFRIVQTIFYYYCIKSL